MANRYDNEPSDGGNRSDEFRNRGRNEWDDDHGNRTGGGYGRGRFDEDNDQGRSSAQGYYDDRYNDRSAGSRSGRFDQDWSDRMPYDQGDNGGWRGRGGYTEGGYDQGFGQRGNYGSMQGSNRDYNWRQEQGFGSGQGNQRRFGGFGGGSAGYGANRDFRQGRDRNYGGADLSYYEDRHGHGYFGEGDFGRTNTPQGRFGQGGMTGFSGYGTGSGMQRDFGPYAADWAETGRMAGGPMSHHDEDYHHWRSQQIGKLDKDYQDWRNERRKKFSDEFEKWRSSRPQQADDETLGNANSRSGVNASGTSNTTGSSQSGSSRHK
jgi:hypothetical protein